MEWFRRRPKTAAVIGGAVVLLVLALVWGMASGSSDAPSSEDPILEGTPLPAPSTSTDDPGLLASPSASPTSVDDLMQALTAGTSTSTTFGQGTSHSLTRHRVTLTVRSDGPLMAVGWWVPLADGERKGSDTSQSKTFEHSATTYGDGDLGRVLGYGGGYSKRTWCTVSVDGKVTDRQEARGPYGQVICQG